MSTEVTVQDNPLNSDDLIQVNPTTCMFWGVGGTGINQMRSYRSDQPKNQSQLAIEKFAYIDTSLSNLPGVAKADTYILNEGRGLGKDQKEGDAIFEKEMPAIMSQFNQPGDTNVVFFGLSGGTGSTGGRKLVKRLVQEGHNVVAIVTADFTSDRSTANALATMLNLEMDLKDLETPYAVVYAANDPTKSFIANNTRQMFMARMASMLGSGKNAHLDRSDVFSFFHYPKVSRFQPALCLLEVFTSAEELKKASEKNVIFSYAALMKSTSEPTPQLEGEPGYDTVGYLPEEGKAFENSFMYTLSASRMAPIIADLRQRLANFRKKTEVVATVTSLVDDKVERPEGGSVYL